MKHALIKRFYVGRILGGPTGEKSRPIPVWLGQLIFIAVGTLFILAGFGSLLFNQ